MRLRLTIDLHLGRDEPEPPSEREVNMGTLAERAETPRVGFTPQQFPAQDQEDE